MTQRLDQLTAPAEVGTFYLVPTVRGEWRNRIADWPVIGPRHSDAQHLNFDHDHYHLDPRFVVGKPDNHDLWLYVAGAPLMTSDRINQSGLPKPILRRRLCRRTENPISEHLQDKASRYSTWRCHFEYWAGKQARHDGRGWVCPHRSVSLADHAPVNGVITCPLHLLRIDASNGIVLPPIGAEESK